MEHIQTVNIKSYNIQYNILQTYIQTNILNNLVSLIFFLRQQFNAILVFWSFLWCHLYENTNLVILFRSLQTKLKKYIAKYSKYIKQEHAFKRKMLREKIIVNAIDFFVNKK